MTRAKVIHVVVCADGLGTRIAGWARYIPKELYPVEGRPGIVHMLEEISVLGPAEVVIVCHPYYDAFTTWARAALSPDGHDSYLHAARLPAAASPTAGFTFSFITQHGPYADSFARSYRAPMGTEPKLALALVAYARTHPVLVTKTSAQVIFLDDLDVDFCGSLRPRSFG